MVCNLIPEMLDLLSAARSLSLGDIYHVKSARGAHWTTQRLASFLLFAHVLGRTTSQSSLQPHELPELARQPASYSPRGASYVLAEIHSFNFVDRAMRHGCVC
jgi:hypothetical protein